MHIPFNLMPLAHGALGSLDEIIPIALIGGMAVIFVVVGFMSRRNEGSSETPEQSPNPPPSGEQTAPDHFRLD